MSDNKKHEPAFPVASPGGATLNIGMSLRDYFAAKAMEKYTFHEGSAEDAADALRCYEIADAMISARNQTKEPS